MAPKIIDPQTLYRNLIHVLENGQRTSTYKLATMTALVDIGIKHRPQFPSGVLDVPLAELARGVIGLYWNQIRPFQGAQLRQSTQPKSRIFDEVEALRSAADCPEHDSTLEAAAKLAPGVFRRVVDEVSVCLAQQPLPRLQRTAGSAKSFSFLYDDSFLHDNVTRAVLARHRFAIQLKPGVAHGLALHGEQIRLIVQNMWVDDVLRINRLAGEERPRIEEHLFGHVLRPLPSAQTTRPPPGTDWLKAHEPLPPPIEIVGPSRAAKALSLVMSTVAILGAVALVTRSQIVLSGLVLLTWAAAMTAGVFTLWRRSDALAGRTAARRQLKLADREVNAQKIEVSKAQKARAALDGAERKELQKLEDQRSKLPQASKSEVEKQSKDLLKKMTALQSALNKVDSAKSAEVSRQLKDVQDQQIQAYLASCRIEPGVIPGIGPALVTALAVHGLRTAADFAGFRDNEFRKNGSNYWFTVSGIGPTKSDAIYGWHRRQTSIAQGRAPLSLTTQQMNAIDNTFVAQKRQHQASIDSLTKQLQTVKASIDLKYNTQDREIAQKMDAVRLDYKQRRLVSDTATTQAEIERQRRENALLDAQRELARYQTVSVSAYLKA
jgi:hypothetical protein